MFKSIFTKFFKKEDSSSEKESSPDLLKSYEKIINEIVFCVSDEWDKIIVHFEYYPYEDSFREIHQSKYFYKNNKTQFTISIDVADAFILLNKSMTNKDKENWTSCDLEFDNTGKYNFNFGYGMPPLLKEMLILAGEL